LCKETSSLHQSDATEVQQVKLYSLPTLIVSNRLFVSVHDFYSIRLKRLPNKMGFQKFWNFCAILGNSGTFWTSDIPKMQIWKTQIDHACCLLWTMVLILESNTNVSYRGI
jgi:hypothetical protein